MKKLFLIIGLVLILSMVGCAGIQTSAVDIGKIDVKNAEVTRQFAKDLLSTWHLNSGFIKGALGDKIGEFPAQAVAAMNELDQLSLLENPDDYTLGYSLGIRVRLLSVLVQEAIKLYAPEVLKYFPALFSF